MAFSAATDDLVRIPIMVGSMGRRLVRAFHTEPTYEWKLYVKSFYDEDLSKLIRQIDFELSPMLNEPNHGVSDSKHVICEPPYVVKDIAYGSFDVNLTVHLKNYNEKQVKITHTVKLLGAPLLNNEEKMCEEKWLNHKNVIQIVYHSPSPALRKILDEFSEIDDDINAKIEKNYKEQESIKEAIKKLKAEIMEKKQKKGRKK